MLKFLGITDFVIVSSLELSFSRGFTALTGETGAGKSILVDAVSLALGERGDAGMVRSGCERAEISAEFDIAGLQDVQAWLQEQGLEGDEGVCLMRRVVDSGGRSRGFINGRSATLQQLREVGDRLINIHGQNAHQALVRPEAQRTLLDGYGGITAEAQVVAQKYREWQGLRRRRIVLSENVEVTAAERDLLQFQRSELETLGFSAPDWKVLQEEYARLSHGASLLETAAFGIDTLSESEGACLAQLNALAARLLDGKDYDVTLREPLQLVESARAELQEAVYALRHFQQRLDPDPERIRELEQRIQTVIDTARKYRVAPEQLGEALHRVLERLSALGADEDLAELERQELVAHQHYMAAAQKLTAARKKAAVKLAEEITAALQSLALQGGVFAVNLNPLEEGAAFGLEEVEFQVAANPGVPPRSLAKVASGGELSRISLAIQVATSKVASVPTLIFDEVDTGIGGRVAEIVGKLLRQLGRDYQVLCVTHLPQVAATADHHWCVTKLVENGATRSSIDVLLGAQRVDEIARMLGGVKITETTRKHASEMLRTAS